MNSNIYMDKTVLNLTTYNSYFIKIINLILLLIMYADSFAVNYSNIYAKGGLHQYMIIVTLILYLYIPAIHVLAHLYSYWIRVESEILFGFRRESQGTSLV